MKNEATKHVNQIDKGAQQSALGEAGTRMTGKSHEEDVMRGEGKSMNYGTHEKVRDAKAAKASDVQAARAAHERRENNNADPTGDCGA